MTLDDPKQEDELRELAVRLRQGDVDALHELFGRLGPAIFGQLAQRFRGVLQSDEIEDILAVALYDLWRQRERYNPERGAILSWFYLLARHAAVDWLRGRHRLQLTDRRQKDKHTSPVLSEKLPADLLRRLEALLEMQTAEDRDILMTFAASGGKGSWAAEVASRWGVSANVVSQRKKRLLGWLRQTLLAGSAPSGHFEVEEIGSMSMSAKWVEQLEAHQSTLRKLGTRLAKVAEQSTAHGAELRSRFARQWNEALREEAGPARRARLEVMKRSWAWMEGLLGAGEKYRRALQGFVDHCRKDPRLSKSTLFEQPNELVVERLEQGIVGVADAIERRMPPEVRRKRWGEVQLEWQDLNGGLDAQCTWKEHFTGPKIQMLQTACSSMQSYSELDPMEAEACAGQFLRDLRVGAVTLPDFQRAGELHQTPKVTTLQWRPEVVEPVSASLAAEPLPEVDERFDLEQALWRDFPEAAAAVDEVICAAVADDYRQTAKNSPGAVHFAAKAEMPTLATASEALELFRKRGDLKKAGESEPSNTLQVIHELQKLLGRSEAEVLLLLAPLVEARGVKAGSPVPCPDRQQTLAFLWAQIIGR